MKATFALETGTPLVLAAETAADLMTTQIVSVRDSALLREALVLLIDKGISAAPVIDEGGRPVGVLSRSDLLVHDRESGEVLGEAPEYFGKAEQKTDGGEPLGRGFPAEKMDFTRVRDVMTPTVFCVAPDTPSSRVVHDLLGLEIHRLFVVDVTGVLVGVVSATDVLRHLHH
jgi:CBS-domain-containing membrane protein